MDGVTQVGIVAADADREAADQLSEFLEIAGLDVISVDFDSVLPGMVVLISHAAIEDQQWQERVEVQLTSRLVPVRLEPVADAEIPSRLAQRQRVEHDPRDPLLTWSTVITALRSDPTATRATFDFQVRAATWDSSGRPSDILLRDRRILARYATLLEDPAAAGSSAASDPRPAYLEAAFASVRRRLVRRVVVAGAALLIVAAIVGATTDAFEAIQQAGRTSRGSVVTIGLDSINKTPEWTSLQAAAVMINGTEPQQQAARRTIADALALPWGPNLPSVSDGSVEAIRPLERSGDPLYLIGRGAGRTVLARFDASRNEPRWEIGFDTMLWGIAIDRSESVAYTIGDSIHRVVLDTQEVTRLSDERFDRGAVLEDGRVSLGAWTGRLAILDPATGQLEEVPSEGQLIDLQPVAGGAHAVLLHEGRYELIDAVDGASLAVAEVGSPTVARGGAFPDAASMVVVGSDQQLWTVEAGQEAVPTGIAVPERTFDVIALSNGRVAFGGQSSRVVVWHVDTAIKLGNLCHRGSDYHWFQRSVNDRYVACLGPVSTDIGEVPPGPLPHRDGLQAATDVEIEGARIRLEGSLIVGEGDEQTLSIDLFEGSATAIALAPEGERILVGTDIGEVVIYSVQPTFGPGLVRARTPDRAAVTRVGWQGETPVVETSLGNRWAIPDCPGCGDEDGLLAHVIQRLPRCWGEDQLTDLDRATRVALDVDSCGG